MIAFPDQLHMRTTRQKHQSSMDVSKVDASSPVMRPHGFRRAGVVSCPDMALQPYARQLMRFGLCHDSQTYRKFAVNDFKSMWFLATHKENITGTHWN